MNEKRGESSPSGLVTLLATGFGSGLLPRMPGTWGSLAALAPAYALQIWVGPWGLALAAVFVFFAGIGVSDAYMARTGRADPGEVVIDEVAGQWIALVPAATDPLLFGAGFVLFRVFDIWKPWPVGWADRTLKDGLGVMADDVLAGLYAAILVAGLRLWMG